MFIYVSILNIITIINVYILYAYIYMYVCMCKYCVYFQKIKHIWKNPHSHACTASPAEHLRPPTCADLNQKWG